MYESLLANTFKVYRETSSVYTKTPPVADDQSPGVTIADPDNLEVKLSGFADGTGSVTIDGTDDNDGAISETITFPGNGQKISSNIFKTVTRVRTSGLADESTTGTLTIETATASGEGQPVFSQVATIVGRLVRPETSDLFVRLGEDTIKRGAIHTKPGQDIQTGDKITLGSEMWEVEKIQRKFNKWGEVHHWQLIIMDLESPAA